MSVSQYNVIVSDKNKSTSWSKIHIHFTVTQWNVFFTIHLETSFSWDIISYLRSSVMCLLSLCWLFGHEWGCGVSAFFPLMHQLFLHLCTVMLKVTFCYLLWIIWQPLPVPFLPPNSQAPSLISHKGNDNDWATMVWLKMWYVRLWQARISKEYTWHQIFHAVLAVVIPRWLVIHYFCPGFAVCLSLP